MVATCWPVTKTVESGSRIEIAHLTRDPRRERAGVEVRDRTDAASALADIAPRGRQVVADRRDDTQTGYHYTSFHTSV